jgi:signal transduction histidine kinase
VRISYRPRELVVDVTDDGRGAATSLAKTGSGQGLIGMRERVEIYGGEITSGPRPGGGFTVHAVLPIVEQAAGPAPTAADDVADTVSERGVR